MGVALFANGIDVIRKLDLEYDSYANEFSWIRTLSSTSSCFVRLLYMSEFSLITSVAVLRTPRGLGGN
mgnify:CR=1 FL=1